MNPVRPVSGLYLVSGPQERQGRWNIQGSHRHSHGKAWTKKINIVMESHGIGIGKKNKVTKFENILKKSWKRGDFSWFSAYHKSRMRCSIYIQACCSDLSMGSFWFMFKNPNRNVRQEAYHLFHS